MSPGSRVPSHGSLAARFFLGTRTWYSVLAALLVGFVLVASGCGYHTAGHARNFRESVKTIAVPAFKNETLTYRIEQMLTASVVREFTTRTRYHIVSDPGDDADATCAGRCFRRWRLR